MTSETPTNASDEIRYAPRAVADDEWIRAFLARQPTGVFGFVDEGSPYLVSQLFVYDEAEHAVFFHGANTGRTRNVVERDGEACFTVTEMGRLLPAEKPVNFDVEYSSVVVFGRTRRLADPNEKHRVLEQVMAKFAPQMESDRDYEPISDASVDRTSVYRLDVDRWSAKRNWEDADFSGAYDYEPSDDRPD